MSNTNFSLLKKLCEVHAPSGNESAMTSFLLNYINSAKNTWKVQPQIFHGNEFQNCIVLIFGKPTTAIYAHIDNIGFMTRYNNELVRIGGPRINSGDVISGYSSEGNIKVKVVVDDENNTLKINSKKIIETGTDFSFDCNFRESDEYIQSCYLDNRLGVFSALQVAETLTDGAIVFSCWEEHGGGSVGYICGWLLNEYKIRQALISDITWITEGVQHGKGVAVSIRDIGIPRRDYVNKIRNILDESAITYQLEVESSGGSDGTEIQKSPFLIDWCFVGAAEDFVHSPNEKVHKADIKSMIEAYTVLMKKL